MNRLLLTAALLAVIVSGQKFEVSTVKPNSADDKRIMIAFQEGGRLVATGVTLKILIQQAYDVRAFQVSGGPAWVASERFDIQAKAEGVTGRVQPDQVRPMLQKLLEDRFHLTARRETKEMPIYGLVLAKGGSKLKPAAPDSLGKIRIGFGLLEGGKVGMKILATQLSDNVGRLVVDQTGLTGDFDVKLQWTPEPGTAAGPFGDPRANPSPQPDNGAPTIFTAVQEQLGLRLDSQKGPTEVIVIERAEKPTEN